MMNSELLCLKGWRRFGSAMNNQSSTTVTRSARNNTIDEAIMNAALTTTQRVKGSPKNIAAKTIA